ncbi:MAG: PAS domain S-box protein [bacterium]|nr:PAS domain S-box protein [bacterium]
MANRLHVLLIEDNEDDALLLVRHLKTSGFDPRVRRVESRTELAEALDQSKWDIVISDYSLPGFDGLTALKIVHDSGIDLPFIIVSGTIGEDVAVDAMRAGAHDYVMKDKLARLGPAVTRELREAEERRARRRAEAAYRSLVESSLQGFVIMQDRRVVFANSAMAQMLGCSVKDLLGRDRDGIDELVHPDDRERVWNRYSNRIAGEPAPDRYEFRLLRVDGEPCWVEISANRIEFEGRPATQATFADVTTRVRRDLEQHAIASAATSLRLADDRSEVASVILDRVLNLLDGKGAALTTLDPETNESVYAYARGAWVEIEGERVTVTKGISGRVFSSGEAYISNDVASDPHLAFPIIAASTKAVVGVPLIAESETLGVLLVGRNRPISQDDIVIVKAIAEMTASALRRITLNEELALSNVELTEAYDSTLEGWARALELRDSDTQGHTRRVTDLTVRLGRKLGLEDEVLVDLRRGALLHDIGKVAIPDHVLRKPGALDEDEWVIMRRHAEYAFEMLSPIAYLRRAIDIPYCHHEQWDGNGYPHGLSGEEIPLAARIFAVVDVWDALLMDRPYRAAWTIEKTVRHMRDLSGIKFDPDIVSVFLEMVGEDSASQTP